jgi:hypothetical protein
MPCQDDIERGRRFRRILDLENESSRRQKQHNHDEDGRLRSKPTRAEGCPKVEPVRPANSNGTLGSGIQRIGSIRPLRKYPSRERKNEHGEFINVTCGGRRRRQDAGHREGTFAGSGQRGNLYNRGYERVLECPSDVLT